MKRGGGVQKDHERENDTSGEIETRFDGILSLRNPVCYSVEAFDALFRLHSG